MEKQKLDELIKELQKHGFLNIGGMKLLAFINLMNYTQIDDKDKEWWEVWGVLQVVDGGSGSPLRNE